MKKHLALNTTERELLAILKCSSNWDDIYNNFTKYQKLHRPYYIGRLFELFCKYYYLAESTVSREYKNVWLFSETPSTIKTKLNLGKIDYGIDLILEGYDGALSAIQCKFKSNQNVNICWTKDKIANLFAEGDQANYLIVFTNASGLDSHSITKKEQNLTLVSLGDLLNLSTNTIKNMSEIIYGNTLCKPSSIKTPRPDQEKAIEKVIQGFSTNNRGQLVLPCGAGKTLIALWIKERLETKHTIVLVPSLALLRQIKNEWSANAQRFTPYICVCSEQDIDRNDGIITKTYEVSGKVSTDPKEVHAFLNKHEEAIVYSTYQSLSVIADAIKDTSFIFDLAICDEAHKTSGNRHSQFGLIHHDQNISIKQRLYMTATPRVLSSNLKKEFTDEIKDYLYDMSNRAIYGDEFYRMSFKEAIEKQILVDYKIVAIGVDHQELFDAIKQRAYVSQDETIDEVANNLALEKFMNKYSATHAITFHASVKKAKKFQERHRKFYPELNVYHVNGNQSTNERSVFMKMFASSKKSVITNARCLTEGVDVPTIDIVYFCDPKGSKIDIVQATGRALRKADHREKSLGYIVVPIFHSEREKVEDIIERSSFKNLINVARALCAHDERLLDEIKQIKTGIGKHHSSNAHFAFNNSINLVTLQGFHYDLQKNLFDQVISKIRLSWRSFEEARALVHTLGLKSKKYWEEYCKSGKKPEDIPTNPAQAYKNYGWLSWGDWLGTGVIASQNMFYRPYMDARIFVHSIGLKSKNQWATFAKSNKKPDDIPANPAQTYKQCGWVSWGDWLGTGIVATQNRAYYPFYEARNFVQQLGLKSISDWQKYTLSGDKPIDIPSCPDHVYKDCGWISYGDWLGSGIVATYKIAYREFKEARAFIHGLGLTTQQDWINYCKSDLKPKDIPTAVQRVYKNKGWHSMGNWLGTGTIAHQKKIYRPFDKARALVHTLGLKSKKYWEEYCKSGKKPADIPAFPNEVYKDCGWHSWPDWFGSDYIPTQNRVYKSFDEARKFVQALGLKSFVEWRNYSKSDLKPKDIPAYPNEVYKNKGWISYGDWLGTGVIAPQKRKGIVSH